MNFNPIDTAGPEFSTTIPEILPHKKVYSIQVGNQVFKLSGASLSSDSPSYFTDFFLESGNEDKTLFLDRSPKVFEFVYSHLLGYAIDLESDFLYYQLMMDTAFYSLSKLYKILQDEYGIFARIGAKSFCIPTRLFENSGNHLNFFSINKSDFLDGFDRMEKIKLFRPPPSRPIWVPHKSAELFNDILELLRGNNSVVKDDSHRQALLQDCRYYRFSELEQRLIKHKVLCNPYNHCEEIIINIDDIHRKGLSLPEAMERQEVELQYSRPFMCKQPKRDLIFQIDSENNKYDVKLYLNKSLKLVTTKFSGPIFFKMQRNLSDFIPSSNFLTDDTDISVPAAYFITTLRQCQCTINGLTMKQHWVLDMLEAEEHEVNVGLSDLDVNNEKMIRNQEPELKKRKLERQVEGDVFEFRLTKSQWKLSIIDGNPKLIGVNIVGNSDLLGYIKDNVDFL